MSHTASNPYLRSQVLTASPEKLRAMLYDGSLRFCRKAQDCLAAEDFEGSYENVTRAQKIVLELMNSLRPELMPEVCDKLSALYTYIYKLLIQVATDRDPAPLEEAIGLLDYQRQTWQMLMEQNSSGDTPPAAPSAPAAGPASPYQLPQPQQSSLLRSA
jgi:flagellar protein FliS